MLSTNQRPNLREAALEILLLFYEALGDPEKEFVNLLPGALDMTPFLPDFPADTHFRTKSLPADTVLIGRDPKMTYSKEESLALINIYLQFMSEPLRQAKFQQWFGFLRQHILPTLYPTICRQLGLLDAADNSGFTQHCPYEIQASIVHYLQQWTSKEEISAWLWGEQAALMLEIYRQACLMPATRHEDIKKALFVFKDCLFTNVPKTIPDNLLVSFRQWYWNHLTFIVPESPLTQDHYKLIAESLNLYDSVVASLWTVLSPAVQEIILLTALDLATRALKRPDSGGVDRLLCSVLVDGLLMLWVNARVTDPNLWRALQERLRTFFHRKDAILQCKFKLIQLTLVLENFMFSFDAYNKYEFKKSKQQTKRSESQFPDPILTFDIRPDPVIKEKDWDWNSAQLVWFNILEIFRYTNGLEDPGAYLESIDALTTVAEMIVSAYERSDFEEPELPLDAPPGTAVPPSPSSRPSLSLISIFGPWLFEAAKRPIVYAEGKALANRTLCRLVVRQSHINLPLSLLAHFYDCVQVSLLDFSCSKAAWAILEHSTGIFSSGLPGANLLIPYYLTEISKIFTKVDHIPEKVRESALIIIGSLICMPKHFSGISIPFDSESAKLYKLAEPVVVAGVGPAAAPGGSVTAGPGNSTAPGLGIGGGSQPAASTGSSNALSYADLKQRVLSLLTLVVLREPKTQLVCMALSTIHTFIMSELHRPDATSSESVLTLIRTVITCTLKEYRIAHSALSCLSGLASSHQKLHALDNTIVSRICYQLIVNITNRQSATSPSVSQPGLELTMVAHYEALQEWMMCVPPSFYEDAKLVKRIFTSIDVALKALDAVPTPLSPSAQALGSGSNSTASSGANTPVSTRLPAGSVSSGSGAQLDSSGGSSGANAAAGGAVTSTSAYAPGQESSLGPTGTKVRLRRAVEQLLIYMSNFSNNWPLERHYDIFQSQMIDYIEDVGEKAPNSAAAAAAAATSNPSSPGNSVSAGAGVALGAGATTLTSTDELPPPPPTAGVDPSTAATSLPPFVKETLWYTMNNEHVLSVIDFPQHKAEALDTNDQQALTYILYSSHYIYFFRAFLRDQGLADAVTLYHEDEQYRASGADRREVHLRIIALIKQAIAGHGILSLDQLSGLRAKLNQSADQQLWHLLLACFAQFKNSAYWSNSQEHIVRLTTRDSAGKYTWDWTPIAEWDQELRLRIATREARNTASIVDGNFDLLGGQTWRMDELSETAEPAQTQIPDFESLLTTFQQNPFGNSPDFFAPKQLMDETHALMLEYSEAMNLQQQFVDNKLAEKAAANAAAVAALYANSPSSPHTGEVPRSPRGSAVVGMAPSSPRGSASATVQSSQNSNQPISASSASSSSVACEPPQPATLLSRTHLTKNFLKQFGFLTASKYSNFTLLDTENPRFKRLIKQFDSSTYGHEVTKIGLVYVKDGQENERSMLRNEEADASRLYHEFVSGMTTIVPIARHCGYVGGLDRSGSVGTTLPYWRNTQTELVVHEVTRMPTVHKDPQQILKKRHVGNDIIHVIWSEHCRDYKPQTIVSQFNDAHIMIFPLPNGLFRIRVAQKREVAPFGPLIHNMAITKDLLSILARQTAITANSVVRFSHEQYMGQYASRMKALCEIVGKNAKPGYSDYIAACFPTQEMPPV